MLDRKSVTQPELRTAALFRSHIAVLVPCYNEEVAIAKVVADFRSALPEATIYVYDNNSRDQQNNLRQAGNIGCGRQVYLWDIRRFRHGRRREALAGRDPRPRERPRRAVLVGDAARVRVARPAEAAAADQRLGRSWP